MKTIKEFAKERIQRIKPIKSNIDYCIQNGKLNGSIAIDLTQLVRDSVKFAQEWINVDEEIECNINIDGIMYSENVLLKVKDFEFPLVGCYVRANDDEFWEIYGDFKVDQKDITHYRFVELK